MRVLTSGPKFGALTPRRREATCASGSRSEAPSAAARGPWRAMHMYMC